MVRDAEWFGEQFKSEVAAVSSCHAIFQVDDMIAMCYEYTNLGRDLVVGDRVMVQYGRTRSQVHEQGKEPIRGRGGKGMQMERKCVPTPR